MRGSEWARECAPQPMIKCGREISHITTFADGKGRCREANVRRKARESIKLARRPEALNGESEVKAGDALKKEENHRRLAILFSMRMSRLASRKI